MYDFTDIEDNSPSSNFDIIYIGDDENIRQDIKLKINKEKKNFNIKTMSDTEEALSFITNNECHCVIGEYEVPKVNGIKFLDKIRKDFNIPFILLTDMENEDVIDELVKYNSSDYMTKDTYNNTILVNRIETLVDKYISEKTITQQSKEIENKKRFTDQAINSLQDIFFVLSKDGSINQLNNSGKQFVSKQLNKNANTLYDLFLENQEEHITNILQSVRKGNNIRVNLQTETKCDEKIEFEVKASPLSDKSGNTLGIVGIARDVTEQNEYKRNLKYKNKKLDKFAKIISHDIRNPVSIAKGNLDLYIAENGENEHIDSTYNAIERIENILENILEITKTDESELETQYQNLNYITQDCWNNLQINNATLNINTNKMMDMNSKLASRLFENLFKNSIEHGGEDIEITIGALTNGFYVEDNGKGISKEKREKIFDASYTTSGIGLGLTIVEHVCDIHHWNIEVKESSAGGARFEITKN